MEADERNARIAAIIDHALEGLKDWRRPTPMASIGPGFPHCFDAFERELTHIRGDLRNMLERCSDKHLSEAFPDSIAPKRNPLFDPHGLHFNLAKRLQRLKKAVPADFVGGWAIAERAFEPAYWRGFKRYSLGEATLLCVGRDPRQNNFDGLMRLFGRSDAADQMLYFLEEMFEAIAGGFGLPPEDSTAPVEAQALYDWIVRASVTVDPRFRRMLRETHAPIKAEPQPARNRPDSPGKPIHRNSLRAHARLVGAMAMAKYGLQDAETIGRAVKAIVNDSHLQGLTVDDKLVRSLLQLALAQVDDTET